MSDGYESDTTLLAGQAAQLEPLAGEVTSIHGTLSAALAEAGACWGSDPVGQSFGGVHAVPADATLRQLGELPARLGSVGTRLTDTAARYESDDEHGVERLRAAGPEV